MVRQTREGVGVESVLRRYFHSSVQRAELVTETDAIGDLGAELKPREIEIAAKADLCKIVHEVEEHGFLAVAADVDTHTAAGDDIRPVVAFTRGTPLEIERYAHRHGKDIECTVSSFGVRDGVTALGLVGERSARELDTRREAQVEVLTEPEVRDETDMETRQQTADPCVIRLRLTRDRVGLRYLAVRHTERSEVNTQLKAHMEELVVHIRPVHCLLGEYGSTEYRVQNTDQ